jgi:hypothetical protein
MHNMRAVECPCGEHIEGSNDGQILEAMKQHATDEHEGEYSEADLRLLVNTAAYDAAAV